MQVLILAGGLGTRLRPLVGDRPKPMVEAGGRPFLEYQIEQLRGQGFREFVLCVAYHADRVETHFGDGRRWDVSIAYAVERELLGTAGAIRNARRWIGDTFLVLNGDTYLEVDYRALVASHRPRLQADPHTLGTLVAVSVDDATASGTLELDAGGRVQSFREKASSASGWINGGAYVLEPEILDLIPEGRAVSIEKETFPLALRIGWHLYAHPTEGFFVDIGTPDGYRRFQQYLAHRDV